MATVNASEGKFVHHCWIEDTNSYKLEVPPVWFLNGLRDYDAQLVLVPSRKSRKYLLCRRRKDTAGLGDVALVDNKHPDTNMCYAYGLLPIAPLYWQKTQTSAGLFTQLNLESLLDTLKRRDAWALGGGPGRKHDYVVADEVDLFDEEQEKKRDQALWDMFYHMGRDAWRSLKARTGQRNKRASDHHGVAAKPRTGQRVILTDAQ